MNISLDEEKFNHYQEEMLCYLAKRVKELLREKGVDDDLIYDITGDLVFEIGAIIDASAVMGDEKTPILPYLAFSKSEAEREDLIASPNGSSLHEMAYGFVDELFEEE